MLTTMKIIVKHLFAILQIVVLIPENVASTRQPCRTPGFFRSSDGDWCLHLSLTEQNFAASSVFCQAYGGTLVTIENEEKQLQVEQFLKEFPNYSWSKAFVGATRVLSDNAWVWYQRGQMNHTNWDAGDPRNQQGYACAVMKLGMPSYKWQAIHCLQEQRYICQKENTSDETEDNI